MFEKLFLLPRWVLLSVPLILMVILMKFCIVKAEESRGKMWHQINHPVLFENKEITFSFVRIDKVQGEKIRVLDNHRGYDLIGSPSLNIREGQTYSIIAIITKSDGIQIKEIQHHPRRVYKYLLSGTSLFVVLFLIVKNIRLQKKGFFLTIK